MVEVLVVEVDRVVDRTVEGTVEGVVVGGQQTGTVALHFATCPSLDGGWLCCQPSVHPRKG